MIHSLLRSIRSLHLSCYGTPPDRLPHRSSKQRRRKIWVTSWNTCSTCCRSHERRTNCCPNTTACYSQLTMPRNQHEISHLLNSVLLIDINSLTTLHSQVLTITNYRLSVQLLQLPQQLKADKWFDTVNNVMSHDSDQANLDFLSSQSSLLLVLLHSHKLRLLS